MSDELKATPADEETAKELTENADEPYAWEYALRGMLAEREMWVSALVYQNAGGVWIFANPHEFSMSKIEFPDEASARRACLEWLEEHAYP